MPFWKRRVKVATGLQRPALPAVLYLLGVLLVLNAWLVSQQIIRF